MGRHRHRTDDSSHVSSHSKRSKVTDMSGITDLNENGVTAADIRLLQTLYPGLTAGALREQVQRHTRHHKPRRNHDADYDPDASEEEEPDSVADDEEESGDGSDESDESGDSDDGSDDSDVSGDSDESGASDSVDSRSGASSSSSSSSSGKKSRRRGNRFLDDLDGGRDRNKGGQFSDAFGGQEDASRMARETQAWKIDDAKRMDQQIENDWLTREMETMETEQKIKFPEGWRSMSVERKRFNYEFTLLDARVTRRTQQYMIGIQTLVSGFEQLMVWIGMPAGYAGFARRKLLPDLHEPVRQLVVQMHGSVRQSPMDQIIELTRNNLMQWGAERLEQKNDAAAREGGTAPQSKPTTQPPAAQRKRPSMAQAAAPK